MVGEVPWVSIASLTAGGALLGLAIYLRRHWDKHGANWFMAALLAHSVLCIAYGIGLLVADPTWRLVLELVCWLGMAWLGYLFLGFALEYTGHGDLRQSSLFYVLGGIPSFGSLLVVTGPWHPLLWTDARLIRVYGGVVLDYTFQFWGYAIIVISITYAGVGVLLLADTILDYGPLYRSEAAAVGLSTVPPAAGVLMWMFDVGPASALNWGVIFSLPHAMLDAYAFVGKDMFETSPTTRRIADRQAIDALSNPVIVLDADDRIVDFNDAACTVFDDLTNATIGSALSAVLPVESGSIHDEQYCSVSTAKGRFEFSIQLSPLRNAHDTLVGYIVLFQDISDERQREQRLTVLNRILRHNLRNKLTVVLGQANRIQGMTSDEELAQAAEAIVRNGEQLSEIGEKAQMFDQLQQTRLAAQEIEMPDFLATVASKVESEHPAAAIETQSETDTTLVTDPDFLRPALANVIENAVEHDPAPHSQVQIRARSSRDSEAIVIEVDDEGPGIPESEIAVITEGDESALEHGSGVGLWITEWCLRRIGGTLSFERTDTGTTVSLEIPCASPGTEEEEEGTGL